MKRKQKITEFFFNEQDSTAEVYTHNTNLKKWLLAYAQAYPQLCQLTEEDENGAPLPAKEENGADLVRGNTVMENAAVSCHAVTAPAEQCFFFNECCEEVPSFSRTSCPGPGQASHPASHRTQNGQSPDPL